MLSQMERLESRSHQQRRCLERAGGEHHTWRHDRDRSRLALGIGVRTFDAGHLSLALLELPRRVRRDDLCAGANRIHEVRRRRTLFPAYPAAEHAVAALRGIAAE